MDIREKNKEKLIAHFEAGAKDSCLKRLGIELEHIVVEKDSKKSAVYYGEQGVGKLLEVIAENYPHRYEPDGMLIGLYNSDYSITLEPAGQLEISISPQENIETIRIIYQSFLDQVMPILQAWGYELMTIGYHPLSKVEDLPLIPKQRYEFMDQHFRKVGSCGVHMMRGTASTQVSVDYTSEADFVMKYRTAYALMPLLKLLTDNTPIFEGKRWQGHMARTYIWDHVDAARTGIFPGLYQENFGFAAYAEFLMKMPVIFIENDNYQYTGEKAVEDIWKEKILSEADVDHILSMNFQDVRLKNYIEIRYADSMPMEYVLAYGALLKGIFYQQGCPEKILEILQPDEEKIIKAQESFCKYGYSGEAYGEKTQKLMKMIFEMAAQGLTEKEKSQLGVLEKLVEKQKTLAGGDYE